MTTYKIQIKLRLRLALPSEKKLSDTRYSLT
jgi:hypothetical protein